MKIVITIDKGLVQYVGCTSHKPQILVIDRDVENFSPPEGIEPDTPEYWEAMAEDAMNWHSYHFIGSWESAIIPHDHHDEFTKALRKKLAELDDQDSRTAFIKATRK